MAKRQGNSAPDGSQYGTVTTGSNALVTVAITTGAAKQRQGTTAPDGSEYMTLTNGSGTQI